jgi:hypothetical protein
VGFSDQVTIQVHVSNADLVVSTVAITQADSTLELALRTVNVPKAKEGLGFSIKVSNFVLSTKF